jgi:hypothetical protein
VIVVIAATIAAVPSSASLEGCAWWNLACKGGEHVANAGLSANTKSIASGAEMLLSQIVLTIDDSSTVPLSDPTYRHVYYGFLGLAVPLIGVVLSIALILAAARRDAATLARAAIGIGVATVGGALYIVFAELLVAIDDSLSHGVVRVTGYNLTSSIQQIAVGFHNIAGAPGEMAANMLLILLMLIMLVSGLILWFVLVLRKIAILVVVAFAPLLIVGYLWAPTRSWVRKSTEVLIALIFTKTAIFTLFGIGLALLSRGRDQSLSDFVGTTVLMCGACFTPLVMLRLVHFAADTHLAGDAMATLRGGVRPVTDRLHRGGGGSTMTRSDFARSQAQAPRHDPAPIKPHPPLATASGETAPSTTSGGPAAAASGSPASGAGAAGAASGAGGAAAGAAGGVVIAGKAAFDKGREAASYVSNTGQRLSPPPDTAERPMRGPDASDRHPSRR